MSIKWIGAILVIISCGGCGFSMAANYRSEVRMYRKLIHLLHYMKSELQYHLTPLPELCEQAGKSQGGQIGKVFMDLSQELKTQIAPDAASCMRTVLNREKGISASVNKILLELGTVLGSFDLNGQVDGLDAVRKDCETGLDDLSKHRDERIRGYQTLGLCSGAALVILFI